MVLLKSYQGSWKLGLMRHKRSMSDFRMRKGQDDCLSKTFEPSCENKLDMGLERCVEAHSTEVQKSLKLEILHLQKQLDDQVFERSALEKALTNEAFHHDPTNKNSISKHAEDLIKEISILEFEVVYLEKYLLSLYRKRFQERIPIFSKSDPSTKSNFTEKWNVTEFQAHGHLSKNEKSTKLPQDLEVKNPPRKSVEFSARDMIVDSSIHRTHSSLSHRFDRSLETTYKLGFEALNPYHSLPLLMLEDAHEDYNSNSNSLGEHLRKNIYDHILETPNWISEEMIKCISCIYTQLVDPPITTHDFYSSPTSFLSPLSDDSPNKWNLDQRRNNSVFSSWVENNNFTLEESKDLGRSYGSVVEVLRICRDSERLSHVKQTLQHFRSLVSKLEKVDLKRTRNEAKLAFWINVHNALVMHAYLVHGISQNSMKRISFILKAAYNVGGHAISVYVIQNSILGCRLPRPGQWLPSLFFPKMKFKVKDARRVYAVDHPEPRLFFALCSGSQSDPSVRLYTPKTIFQDLEAAKEDYIQSTLSINKQGKILLPKIVDLFSKELSLSSSSFMEMFGYLVPNSLRESLQEQQNQSAKFWKRFQWVPHDFKFRFLLSKELIS